MSLLDNINLLGAPKVFVALGHFSNDDLGPYLAYTYIVVHQDGTWEPGPNDNYWEGILRITYNDIATTIKTKLRLQILGTLDNLNLNVVYMF